MRLNKLWLHLLMKACLQSTSSLVGLELKDLFSVAELGLGIVFYYKFALNIYFVIDKQAAGPLQLIRTPLRRPWIDLPYILYNFFRDAIGS